jgi:DUF4097 and DUF4098 domain-containing protein YvlB
MKKGFNAKVSLCYLLALSLLLAGCSINIGSCAMLAKHERQVVLSEPLQPGSLLSAQTHNGSIKVKGTDVTDCNLIATIVAHAATEDAAKELAERTKVKLEHIGSKLVAKIEAPSLLFNQSVTVSFDVTLPKSTNLELISHNGTVEIATITGEVNATTHNGDVITCEVSGTAKLQTHNGSIECDKISGNVNLTTHNGNVNVDYSQTAPPVCDISMVSHNGNIKLIAPPNLSAAVQISTHNGSIKTDLPITVAGKINKNELQGTIGTGEGKLHLETHNGSITIR